MNYTYLLINFFTILIPFVFSFHPKIRFYKTWPAFLTAASIAAGLFIAWDIIFTYLGIWGFNEQHLFGIEIANLPLEEVLFFFCIPYACVFTWYCLNLYFKKRFSDEARSWSTLVLVLFLLSAGIIFYSNIYTAVTFFSLAAILAATAWIFKFRRLVRFYIVYAILLLPFLVVNGILTGLWLSEPVVWYNEMEIIGFRILTIPFEDIFYGMELILINVLLYEYFKDSYSSIKKINYGTKTKKRR